MEGGKTVSKAAYKTAKTNKIKRSRADLIFDIILYTIGTILILITLYPMYFILIASISDPQLVSNGEIMFIPRGVSLKAYKQLLGYTRLWTGYRNTIIYVVLGTIITLAVNIPASYALSRKKFYEIVQHVLPDSNVLYRWSDSYIHGSKKSWTDRYNDRYGASILGCYLLHHCWTNLL